VTYPAVPGESGAEMLRFGRKKHTWSWFALWSLFVSGVMYYFSRFFLHAAEKESVRPFNKKKSKHTRLNREELFI
jgi:hypothetical protein